LKIKYGDEKLLNANNSLVALTRVFKFKRPRWFFFFNCL